jgi:phosphatidylserine/phosphatidylglycerophosphate/cardiolipin synthase-like enzyme/uncharacterized membrane protein YdjX (TVP38/TMEM64 family)
MPPANSVTSLFCVAHNCGSVARARRVALLIDGAAYFDAFMRSAQRAERSILIVAWDFDSRTVLAYDEQGRPRVLLGEFLNGLARRRRRLRVGVLDWDYPMIFGRERELPPLYGLSWKPHRRVHFRYDATHPLAGSHHQKIVVIDDRVAFVGGLDLTSRRWDTPAHRPDDPRRIAAGKPYPPFHDAMVALDGEAAQAVARIARDRWERATGRRLAPVATSVDPWPPTLRVDLADVRVAVACSAPTYNGDPGVHEVEQLYLDMIARARRSIYIENQYFTARKVGEALAARLAQLDCPEIVLVTRLLSHGWLEEVTMHVLRTGLIRELQAADRKGHFHVYYPHVDGLAEGTCIDTHSKLMIVDDEWLRVGSANLSNRSMGLDTECDVVVEAGGAPAVSQAIRRMRDGLLAEHLGVTPDEVASAVERTGSMTGAIRALGGGSRTLKPLEGVPEWSPAVVSAVSLADPERPIALDRMVQQFAPDVGPHRVIPWKRLTAAAVALLALALAWRFTPLAQVVTPDKAIDWADQFAGHWWAPLAVMLAYTPASVVMFPRPLITLAAVVAFGPWLGFVYSMTGILTAAVLAYGAGRTLHRDAVRRVAGERLNRLSHALRQRGLAAMTAVRLVPLAPFVVESVFAGAIRIKPAHYVGGTFLGMLPGVLAATVFGDQLEAAVRDPSSINYWLIGLVGGALLAATLAVRRWFKRLERQSANAGSARPVLTES